MTHHSLLFPSSLSSIHLSPNTLIRSLLSLLSQPQLDIYTYTTHINTTQTHVYMHFDYEEEYLPRERGGQNMLRLSQGRISSPYQMCLQLTDLPFAISFTSRNIKMSKENSDKKVRVKVLNQLGV